jgi:hypothetical protein
VLTDTRTIGDTMKAQRAVSSLLSHPLGLPPPSSSLPKKAYLLGPQCLPSQSASPFPNDKRSADSEELSHILFLKLFNDKPYIAPIEAPRNIIDLGTGTGLWASLVADWFDGSDRPLANVIGVDLAPQQESSVQTNLCFEVDDITNDWATDTLFDLVHIRMLWGVIRDWPKVYAECFKYASVAAPWDPY